jgi:hypothetical protein
MTLAISSIEVIADVAELRDPEPAAHPELVRVLRDLAKAPQDQKFAVLQAGAMSLAPLVTDGSLGYHDFWTGWFVFRSIGTTCQEPMSSMLSV